MRDSAKGSSHILLFGNRGSAAVEKRRAMEQVVLDILARNQPSDSQCHSRVALVGLRRQGGDRAIAWVRGTSAINTGPPVIRLQKLPS